MPEVGYQTVPLTSWTSLAAEAAETNPDLVWPQSPIVFDKMRREDAQVMSVLRAVTLPIRSARWMVDAAGADEEIVRFVAENLGLPIKGTDPTDAGPAPLRTRGRFSWTEHLRLALLELVYGHSFFEQVYDTSDGVRARLQKLAWRPPRTIERVEVAGDGGLVALIQKGTDTREIRIGVERLVAYVNDREGGNWIGQSVLRAAYKNWLLKDRMLRAQALTVERNGLGVPVYTGAEVPEEATLEERKAWETSEKAAGLAIATGFRAGEAAGAAIPNSAKLELMGVTGDLPDTDKPIRYHDEQIARAVLAHFLNLGTETGSWALGSTFADFFTGSLNAVAKHIEDVANQHIVEDLVDINWGPAARAPRLMVEPIGAKAPITAESIARLVQVRALTLDAKLEAYLREVFQLPPADPGTAVPPPPAPAPPVIPEETP